MFPPRPADYQRPDGSVVVPARVVPALFELVTLGMTMGRSLGLPVNTYFVVVLDALAVAAEAEKSRDGSFPGTMVGDSVSLKASDESRWTTGQAAVRLGCSPRAVTKAIQSRKLPGRKVGHQWFITESDLEAYAHGTHRNTDIATGGERT